MANVVVTVPLAAALPDLWGNQQVSRNAWGTVNYLVGPNGSGKTRFAEQLKKALSSAGFKPRYLSAERLAGFEKQNVMGHGGALHRGFDVASYAQYKNYGLEQGLATDAFIVLKEKLDVRIRIEAFLSSLFSKRIRFAEEGGFLKPKMQRVLGGSEYEMKESECHGLKELITVLSFVYDDSFDALIIDEPELHLHPQFQTFLLGEIRRASGDPKAQTGKKVFFLITHSPYLLDFRTLDELRQCLLFRVDSPPTWIDQLDAQDEHLLGRLLPRLNTHHKQFFFAQRPIFVEGHTDQQAFSLIQETRGKLLGATGACFIDVNGKDEQDFFFRLCRNLGIDAKFVSDLDVLFRGGFRKTVSDDVRAVGSATKLAIGADVMDAIRQLNIKLDVLVADITGTTKQALSAIRQALADVQDTEMKRYRTLVAALHERAVLVENLPARAGEIDYAIAVSGRISEAMREAGVYVLPRGELENHFPSYKGAPYAVTDKAKSASFDCERDFILAGHPAAVIEERYALLTSLLDDAAGASEVDLRRYLGYSIGDLIGNIQRAFERGEIVSAETLKQHAAVDWTAFSRIIELVSFDTRPASEGRPAGFECRLRLLPVVDGHGTAVSFSDTTIHSKFTLSA